jgi:ATP-binding cassette, subfamily F, member 3
MIIVSLANVTKTYPSMVVLDNVNLALKKGEKVGLVGPNGIGKTTLMEVINGMATYDSGSVDRLKNLKIAYLPQTPEIPRRLTLFEYLQEGIGHLLKLEQEATKYESKITDGTAGKTEIDRYSAILESLHHHGAYSAESQIDRIASGLGLSRQMYEMPVTNLSGGQQNRAALAKLLIAEPELMLLDEPTNHLDIEGIEFLETYLLESPASAVIVSHDRRFLDKVVTRMWDIRASKVKSFNGNFTSYLDYRQKDDELSLRAYHRQREFISKTENFIRKNIAGQKTNQAKSRIKMLSRIERLEKPPAAEKKIGLSFAEASRSDRIVCYLENVSFAYDDSPVLDDANFTIERGDKVGLLGKNGTGKTTILELATGALQAQKGRVIMGKNIKLGYFRQHRTEFGGYQTPIDIVRGALPELTDGKLRDMLGAFLFCDEDVFRPISSFSGGQKSRLALALLMAAKPNFLVLDEPTNHLDIPSLEVLEDALEEFDGTLLVVSHDRYFLDGLTEKTFVLENGSVVSYPGNYSYYVAKREEQTASEEVARPVEKKITAKKKTARTNPILIKKVEDEIASAEQKLTLAEQQLIDPANASDWTKLAELQKAKTELEEQILLLYDKMNEFNGDDR